MSYSVESINSESNAAQTQRALQEQLLQMQQLKDAKKQEDGTIVEDSSAVSSIKQEPDSVEISTQGQLALEQMIAEKANSQTAAAQTISTITDTTESVSSEKSSTVPVTSQSSDDEDDDVSVEDLYTMTESELRSLVSEGKITKKEMQNELERRDGSPNNVTD